MKISVHRSERIIIIGIALLFAMQIVATAAISAQETQQSQSPANVPTVQGQSQASGIQSAKSVARTTQSDITIPDNSNAMPQQNLNQDESQSAPEFAMIAQQNDAQKPLGTAAAPLENPTGVTASRPSGAVIAPAKQRRARSLFFKVSLVVGAAVAIGTVLVLTHASPGRP